MTPPPTYASSVTQAAGLCSGGTTTHLPQVCLGQATKRIKPPRRYCQIREPLQEHTCCLLLAPTPVFQTVTDCLSELPLWSTQSMEGSRILLGQWPIKGAWNEYTFNLFSPHKESLTGLRMFQIHNNFLSALLRKLLPNKKKSLHTSKIMFFEQSPWDLPWNASRWFLNYETMNWNYSSLREFGTALRGFFFFNFTSIVARRRWIAMRIELLLNYNIVPLCFCSVQANKT